MLAALTALIGGIHYVRNSATAPSGIEALTRGEVTSNTWDDFVKDCGFKSYLGNPIHVTMAFNTFYKNKTFHWEGSVHHAEPGFNLLWFNQRGALFTRMEPAQFPSKPGMADLMMLYDESAEVGKEVGKMKRGQSFDFVATMVEVGRRGAPHAMVLWEVHPHALKPGSKASGHGADQAQAGAPTGAAAESREQNGTASEGRGATP